jgi:ribosome-binding factor A
VTRRTERINEQLRSELAALLRDEVTDPRVRLVTLTRIDVSPDLRNARVYWSPLEAAKDGSVPDEDPEVTAGLASAAGFLRSRQAQRLARKRVPELRFHFDPSLALGSHTLNLIQEIADGEGS